jgi:hypothetical protein
MLDAAHQQKRAAAMKDPEVDTFRNAPRIKAPPNAFDVAGTRRTTS